MKAHSHHEGIILHNQNKRNKVISLMYSNRNEIHKLTTVPMPNFLKNALVGAKLPKGLILKF